MARQMPFRQVRSFIKLRKIKEQAGIHADAKDVYAEAERRWRWNTTLLFKAARILGKEIRHYWDSAWTLHCDVCGKEIGKGKEV